MMCSLLSMHLLYMHLLNMHLLSMHVLNMHLLNMHEWVTRTVTAMWPSNWPIQQYWYLNGKNRKNHAHGQRGQARRNIRGIMKP